MRLLFVNGSEETLSWREMRQVFWHPRFVGLILAFSAIVVWLRPYADLVDFGVVKLTIFYGSGVLCVVTVMFGLVYAIQRRGLPVHATFVVFVSIIIATSFGMGVAVLLGADVPSFNDLALVTLFNLFFGVLGEVIFVSYLVPGILRDIRQGRQDRVPMGSEAFLGPETQVVVADPLPVMIEILGQRFPLAQLRALRAEEHYVRVRLSTGETRLLRGRMSDAVAVLPAEAGRMIHRSHWVAAGAVTGWERDGKSSYLRLDDGSRLPVARARLTEIRDWATGLTDD